MTIDPYRYDDLRKKPAIVWLLWLFTGALGGHRYYLGDVGMGVAMTLTLGGFGVWALIDGLFIQRRIAEKNAAIRAQLA